MTPPWAVPPSRSTPPRRRRPPLRWKPLLALAATCLLGLLIWDVLRAPTLRIDPDAAHRWMGDLDERISTRADSALRSEARSAVNSDFGERSVDPVYLANLNHLAAQVRQVRIVLLEPAALRIQQDMLRDIADLALAMGDCGPRDCMELAAAAERLNAVRGESIQILNSADGIMERTYALSRPGAVDVRRADSLIALHGVIQDAMRDEALLARRTEGKAFQDVNDYRDGLWEIVDIHGELTAEYRRRHRMITVLQMLLGRLP